MTKQYSLGILIASILIASIQVRSTPGKYVALKPSSQHLKLPIQ